MKRKLHSWRRRRSRPAWPYVAKPAPAEIAPRLRQDLRCFCKRCVAMDKRERWGEKWQLSLLPLMGVNE